MIKIVMILEKILQNYIKLSSKILYRKNSMSINNLDGLLKSIKFKSNKIDLKLKSYLRLV